MAAPADNPNLLMLFFIFPTPFMVCIDFSQVFFTVSSFPHRHATPVYFPLWVALRCEQPAVAARLVDGCLGRVDC
jgi:hypothetical protein